MRVRFDDWIRGPYPAVRRLPAGYDSTTTWGTVFGRVYQCHRIFSSLQSVLFYSPAPQSYSFSYGNQNPEILFSRDLVFDWLYLAGGSRCHL